MKSREEILESILSQLGTIRRHDAGRGRALSKEFGITIAQGHMLLIINKAKKISVGDISSELGITISAATQLVDTLEKHLLIVRSIDKEDRRRTNIFLSQKGLEYLERFHKEAMLNIKKIFSGLSTDELQYLEKIAIKLMNQNGDNGENI
jgi:DNA-binding MarR family transcriptional regulator